MKFSIESDGQKEIFFSFRTAEEKTKIPKQTILRVLKSGKETYFRRSDKKVFTIKVENDGPFIQIDGIDFSTDEEIENAFGWSREIFYNRLLKQGGKYFNDCQGVIGSRMILLQLLMRLKKKRCTCQSIEGEDTGESINVANFHFQKMKISVQLQKINPIHHPTNHRKPKLAWFLSSRELPQQRT